MTDKALTIGDIKFTRAPISLKNGIELNTFPSNKYNGEPGGWGTPKIKEVEINSPQSQNDVVGAIVRK